MKSRADKARRRKEAAARAAGREVEAAGAGPTGAGSTAGPRPGQPSPPRRPRRPSVAALIVSAALLGVFAVQALVAAREDSVTIDENLHLAVGLNALQTGDLSQDPVDSHVLRMVAALPLLVDPPVFDPPPGTVSWGLGFHLMQANPERYHEFFVRTRTVVIALSLLAAVVMAKWAFDLYGAGAMVASLAMFAFSPSLLAHGHLITLDMAVTFGFLLALFVNWRLLAEPTLARAAWLGVAVGVANLLKISGLALVAMILVTWLIRIAAEPRRALPLKRWAALLATTGATAILVVNVGYGFEGTFGLLREATLAPGGKLATLVEWMPWLRLPLPRYFIDGIDVALEVGKGHEPSYFLHGQLSADGWWYYHLAAFAAKCPLPVLIAGLGSTAAWLLGWSRGQRDYVVFVPALLLFAANSAFNSLYIGERHVLAAYPLVFLGISPWIAAAFGPVGRAWSARSNGSNGLATSTASENPGDAGKPGAAGNWSVRARTWAPAALAAAGLIWMVAGTVAVAPRYLQYFNETAGGPEGGHRVLVDSNIDWGQDLIRLRRYMEAEGIDQVALAYFGRVHPAVYGIRFTPLERGVSQGKAVVSASFLMGRPYFWYRGGRMRWVPSRTYEWLRGYKPVARVGSMFVFDLP